MQSNFSTTDEKVGPGQVQNQAGAYVFRLSPLERLERFLVLGTEGGTYYQGERALFDQNVACLRQALDEEPALALELLVNISRWGRAPKVSPQIYSLAVAASHETGRDPELVRSMALEVLPLVCRTGSHLLEFVRYVDGLRGWGTALRRGVGQWYVKREPGSLAYQLVKYRQRGGWRHRDVLRKCHVPSHLFSSEQQVMIRYAVAGIEGLGARTVESRAGRREWQPSVGFLPGLVTKFEELQRETNEKRAAELIAAWGLTHEMVPDGLKQSRAVWDALFQAMPLGATIRNLGKLTNVGVFESPSNVSRVICRLLSEEEIRRARIHPFAFLLASAVYGQGHGDKGKLTWKPVQEIVEALDRGFYAAFPNLRASGKRIDLCIDVSDSMTWPDRCVNQIPGFSSRKAAAAMALATKRVEERARLWAFASAGGLQPLEIDVHWPLSKVMEHMAAMTAGETDCSLPFAHAAMQGRETDGFAVYTDNETNKNRMHPFEALQRYRAKMGIPARLAVVAFSATEVSIADPRDGGMLDFVGLDASGPSLIADFFRGAREERAKGNEWFEGVDSFERQEEYA